MDAAQASDGSSGRSPEAGGGTRVRVRESVPAVALTAPTTPASSGRRTAHEEERRSVRDRWFLLVMTLAWSWAVLPRVVETLTAPKYYTQVGVPAIPTTAVAQALNTFLAALLVLACVLAVLDCWRDPHPGRLLGLAVLVAPWGYLVVRDLYVGATPSRNALVYIPVVVAVWSLRPRVDTLRFLGYLVVVAAVVSMAIAVVLPDKGIFRTVNGDLLNDAKAIFPAGILAGFFDQGNNLGQFLALGLPFVALTRRRTWRWVSLAVVVVALVWSASRSSLAAVGMVMLAAVLIRWVGPAMRRWAVPVLVWIPFGLVAVLPFVVTDPLRFSNRGAIWHYSLERWHADPLFGLGSAWYSAVGATSDRLAGSVTGGHNEVVQMLVTGGVLLVVLTVVQLVAVTGRAALMAEQGVTVGLLYLVSLGGTGLLERNLVLVDGPVLFPVVVVPLAVLMCGEFARSGPPSYPSGP